MKKRTDAKLTTSNKQSTFKPGEIVHYAGATYEVIENHGRSGKVRENYVGGDVISPFYWDIYGEKAKRAPEVPVRK